MNISVYGNLTCNDKKLIKYYVDYVLGRFVKPILIKHTKIVIKLVEPSTLTGQDKKDLIEYGAWMDCNNQNKYTITINSKLFRPKQKTTHKRLKDVLLCVGHELVHVKQYIDGDLVDWWDGQIKYKGKLYKDWMYGEAYWTSPWELEAYSWELGLYEMFIKQNETLH